MYGSRKGVRQIELSDALEKVYNKWRKLCKRHFLTKKIKKISNSPIFAKKLQRSGC